MPNKNSIIPGPAKILVDAIKHHPEPFFWVV